MIETSPLHRAAEQPPCSAADEARCLVGMFAVPERMEINLGPHLVFPEHRAIWAAMQRVADGPADSFWWRTFCALKGDGRTAADVRRLLGILNPAQKIAVVSGSEDGCLIFAVSLANLRRCTAARQELSELQSRVTTIWRVPSAPYSAEDKRRLFGSTPDDIGFDIP